MLLNYQIKKALKHDATDKSEIIFLLHGLFGSLSNLALLAKHLNTTHHIVLVDLRNHGQSPQSDSMSYALMAEDIFDLADSLNINTFSLVGHSMGGKVAMACALSSPQRINSLVVADIAPVIYEDKHSPVFEALNSLDFSQYKTRYEVNEALSQKIDSAEVRSFLLKSLHKVAQGFILRFNLKTLYQHYENIRDWPYKDAVFNKKILFIKGADSDYILPSYQNDILKQFPHAQAKIIQQADHWLHIQKAKTFNRLVEQFFQKNAR
ncbi:alpha/beta hydrolase fold protein [Psychromonas sp. CNPT3]|uniref:alpha/beta fold hydrolase n=1 Tax=Psychromonas sp. CNPT3 TaxID=314282 RepID=UPI0002C159C5|nr:alpha/beta fold hydrolase [Psychromonas sp. CNPT3]AGH80553.1 alpha/beta hydrolase fold protein [Psychromonas sp. CNPT3]